MSEMSTLNTDNARAVVTEGSRKDAAPAAGKPAKEGQGGGKALPPVSNPTNTGASDRVSGSNQQVERAIAKLNDYVQSFQRDLRFRVDEDLGRPIVTVVDRETQKVIRQIPNETAIRLARNLKTIQLQEQQLAQQYGEKANAGNAKSLGLINTRI
jgi:flagellar protein FlaG